MAIEFVTAGVNSSVSGTTSTLAMTLSGDNTVLVAMTSSENGNITSVKWNGTDLTKFIGDSTAGKVSGWILINPDLGSHNLVSTQSASSGVHPIAGSQYSGADQTTQPDNSVAIDQGGSGTSTVASITPTVADCFVVMSTRIGTNASFSAGAGTTLRAQAGANDSYHISDSGSGVPASSKTLTVTHTSAFGRAGFIMSITPIPSVGGTGNFAGFLF